MQPREARACGSSSNAFPSGNVITKAHALLRKASGRGTRLGLLVDVFQVIQYAVMQEGGSRPLLRAGRRGSRGGRLGSEPKFNFERALVLTVLGTLSVIVSFPPRGFPPTFLRPPLRSHGCFRAIFVRARVRPLLLLLVRSIEVLADGDFLWPMLSPRASFSIRPPLAKHDALHTDTFSCLVVPELQDRQAGHA